MTGSSESLDLRLPSRVGIDARGLQAQRTGLGNYLLHLLIPLAETHLDTQFFLYSNFPIVAPARPNITVRSSSRIRSSVVWLHFHVPRLLRQDRIDVFWGASGYVPVLNRGCPSVLTLHDFVHRFAGESMRWSTRWNRRIFQSLSVRHADRIAAVSKATADDARLLCGREVDEIVHPIVSETFRSVAGGREHAAPRTCLTKSGYLLSVATVEPRKNLPMMVGAYLAVRRAGVHLPVLALAGGRGWLSDEFEQSVEEAVGRGEVKRLGFVTERELASLYAAAVACILASSYEGFGMPVLEAQVCGAPVVHGTHASMQEAGGGLGVMVGNDHDSWVAFFHCLAAGEAPLACRLVSDIDNDARTASRRMANLLALACPDSPYTLRPLRRS